MAGQERHISDGIGEIDAWARGVEHDMFTHGHPQTFAGGLATAASVETSTESVVNEENIPLWQQSVESNFH